MGRTKLTNRDLALEMSRLSDTSEALAADKQVRRCGGGHDFRALVLVDILRTPRRVFAATVD